jgi:hypothetical protein
MKYPKQARTTSSKSLLKLFYEIYEERKIEDETGEYVVCVDCTKRIYRDQVTIHNFSHEYSKQSYPEYKFDKDKIKIRCYACHQLKDFKQKVTVPLNF